MSTEETKTDIAAGVYGNDEWVRMYQIDDTPWTGTEPEPFLISKNVEIFEGKTKTVFVPLCGKSPDLFWMYQQGHTVVGLDVAEQAVRDVYEGNSLEYTVDNIEKGKLYKSKDERLKIYVMDLYCLSKDMCGQFDVIWDVGSLTAINKCDRPRYSSLLVSLMKPEAACWVWVIDYDPAVWPGPPHPLPLDVLEQMYGDKCKIEMQDKNEEVKICSMVKKAKSNPELPSSKTAMALKTSKFMHFVWYKISLK